MLARMNLDVKYPSPINYLPFNIYSLCDIFPRFTNMFYNNKIMEIIIGLLRWTLIFEATKTTIHRIKQNKPKQM